MNIKIILFIPLIIIQGTVAAAGKLSGNSSRLILKISNQPLHSFKLKIKNYKIINNNTAIPLLFAFQNIEPDVKQFIDYADSASVSQNLKREYVPEWYSMFTNLPGDMVRYYHREFITERIPAYISIAALTAVLIATDEHTFRQSDQIYHTSGFVKSVSDVFVEIGDGRSQFGMAAIFASWGFIAKDSRALRTASQITEAVLASGAVVQVLKHLTGRESPISETEPGGKWKFFPNQIKYHKHVSAYDAFPSGHLTTALAAFVVIAENYPEQKWIYPVAYTVCSLLGIGMVNQGIHWYSDYPLAIAIGYGFGKLIAHPLGNEARIGNSNKIEMSLSPYINYYSQGIQLSLKF